MSASPLHSLIAFQPTKSALTTLLSSSSFSAADLNAPDPHPLSSGASPLSTAIALGFSEGAKVLLEAGADPRIPDSQGWDSHDWASARGILLPGFLNKKGRFEMKQSETVTLEKEQDWNERIAKIGKLLKFDTSALKASAWQCHEEYASMLPIDKWDWSDTSFTQMLVIPTSSFRSFVDFLLKKPPIPSTSLKIVSPLFLFFRWAHYLSSDPYLLHETQITFIDALESAIFSNPDDGSFLLFWLKNLLTLLSFTLLDSGIKAANIASGLESMYNEIIHEIFVFIIRIFERALDDTLLSFLPTDDDGTVYEYKGSWGILRSLRIASALATGSPSNSPQKLSTVVNKFAVVHVLDATLFSIRMFSLPKCIEIQIYSQIIYWFASEAFNKILENKQYLTRTASSRILVATSRLKEWIRDHGFPLALIDHFRKLDELCRWLQCLSSLADLDSTIVTLQSLRSLNPLQISRAVAQYRYEMEETHIADECTSYLSQLKSDWSNRQSYLRSQDILEAAAKSLDSPVGIWNAEDEFTLPKSPENDLEMINSKYMLPFNLPKDTGSLIVTAVDKNCCIDATNLEELPRTPVLNEELMNEIQVLIGQKNHNNKSLLTNTTLLSSVQEKDQVEWNDFEGNSLSWKKQRSDARRVSRVVTPQIERYIA